MTFHDLVDSRSFCNEYAAADGAKTEARTSHTREGRLLEGFGASGAVETRVSSGIVFGAVKRGGPVRMAFPFDFRTHERSGGDGVSSSADDHRAIV